MSTINAKVLGWSAYETGFYNKLVIPQLIDELAAAGTTEDSTGFESTQAIARYALDHPECP